VKGACLYEGKILVGDDNNSSLISIDPINKKNTTFLKIPEDYHMNRIWGIATEGDNIYIVGSDHILKYDGKFANYLNGSYVWVCKTDSILFPYLDQNDIKSYLAIKYNTLVNITDEYPEGKIFYKDGYLFKLLQIKVRSE
jgi:hypothetical protein